MVIFLYLIYDYFQNSIKKGISEARNGNAAYKIPKLKSEDMKALATNINDIAKGLDKSIFAKVKAQRIKQTLLLMYLTILREYLLLLQSKTARL